MKYILECVRSVALFRSDLYGACASVRKLGVLHVSMISVCINKSYIPAVRICDFATRIMLFDELEFMF